MLIDLEMELENLSGDSGFPSYLAYCKAVEDGFPRNESIMLLERCREAGLPIELREEDWDYG